MITAGIDVGAKNVRVVILEDGEVIGKAMIEAGFETDKSCDECLKKALEDAGIERKDIRYIISTGSGRKAVDWANEESTEIIVNARGIYNLDPACRICIDVGAEEARAVKIGRDGKVDDFVVNEKCAAGAGVFVETIARALEVSLGEFANLGLKSDRIIPMNAQCVVFAESEVVSLIHSGYSKEDISKAVHNAMAERIASMVKGIGLSEKIYLVGGVALNPSFKKALEENLNKAVYIPEKIHPQFIGAYGAAILAAERVSYG